MTALSNIPQQAVLPLGAYDREQLERDAQRADQRLLRADFHGTADKGAVLERIAQGFSLPDHFGRNLDALYDCITDLEPAPDTDQPGFVVILQDLPDSASFDAEQRTALLDVFRDAADYFFDHNVAFRVFYSVASRGGGARAA